MSARLRKAATIAMTTAGAISGYVCSKIFLSNERTGLHPAIGFDPWKNVGLPEDEDIHHRDAYALSYNKKRKTANWVCECIGKEDVRNPKGKKWPFVQDPDIDPSHQATHEDYRNSGYSRGHLASAGNHHSSEDSAKSTFYYTNIVPMNSKVDSGILNHLEHHVRQMMLDPAYCRAYICTGPIYAPKEGEAIKTIGPNEVGVPTHVFKCIALKKADSDGYDFIAYIFENEDPGHKKYYDRKPIGVSDVNEKTGYVFFPNLQPQYEKNKALVGEDRSKTNANIRRERRPGN